MDRYGSIVGFPPSLEDGFSFELHGFIRVKKPLGHPKERPLSSVVEKQQLEKTSNKKNPQKCLKHILKHVNFKSPSNKKNIFLSPTKQGNQPDLRCFFEFEACRSSFVVLTWRKLS